LKLRLIHERIIVFGASILRICYAFNFYDKPAQEENNSGSEGLV
jgi:hypothetical protein